MRYRYIKWLYKISFILLVTLNRLRFMPIRDIPDLNATDILERQDWIFKYNKMIYLISHSLVCKYFPYSHIN